MEHTFIDYDAGVRYIQFHHHGKDTQFWKGHFGAKMSLSTVIIDVEDIPSTQTKEDKTEWTQRGQCITLCCFNMLYKYSFTSLINQLLSNQVVHRIANLIKQKMEFNLCPYHLTFTFNPFFCNIAVLVHLLSHMSETYLSFVWLLIHVCTI